MFSTENLYYVRHETPNHEEMIGKAYFSVYHSEEKQKQFIKDIAFGIAEISNAQHGNHLTASRELKEILDGDTGLIRSGILYTLPSKDKDGAMYPKAKFKTVFVDKNDKYIDGYYTYYTFEEI